MSPMARRAPGPIPNSSVSTGPTTRPGVDGSVRREPRPVLGRRRLISSEGGTPPSPPSLDRVSVRVGRLPHLLAVRVTFLRFQILGRDPRCDSRSLPFSVTLTTDEVVHGS